MGRVSKIVIILLCAQILCASSSDSDSSGEKIVAAEICSGLTDSDNRVPTKAPEFHLKKDSCVKRALRGSCNAGVRLLQMMGCLAKQDHDSAPNSPRQE